MTASDIARLLTSLGFTDVTLHSATGKIFTFKFSKYNLRTLKATLGANTMAGGGKVAVFTVPDYGKLGVSPSNNMVRLSYTGDHSKSGNTVNDNHVTYKTTTEDHALQFEKAKISPRFRLKFVTDMWYYFNETKFGRRMKVPIILVSDKPKAPGLSPKTRGYFQSDRRAPGGPGTIWIASNLFNASQGLFNEILLHEMAHQAVSHVDKARELAEAGHGPKWKAWMVKIGLDPRRYDPTDEFAYKDDTARAIDEEDLFAKYGKRATPAQIKKLTRVTEPTSGQVFVEYEGRLFHGKITQRGTSFVFDGIAPNKKRFTLKWKAFPKTKVYQE